jgi:hypothetical protein
MKETFNALPTARKVALVASALCVVSVFLPWASLLGISVTGISTDDGKGVLVLAGVALFVLANDAGLLSVWNVSRRATNLASAIAAGLCLLIAIADLNDFAAFGLYLLLLSSAAWAAAAVVSLRVREEPPAADPAESS